MAEAQVHTLSETLVANVLTPKGSALSGVEVDGITAPGELGEFEVLPGHIPILSALYPGVLTLGESSQKVYAIGSGFLRVNVDGGVDVLVEQAILSSDIDQPVAQKEFDELDAEFSKWEDEQNGEWKNLKARRDWAKARIDASTV
jgi:F-type H+-transporting ATPase subunit epsilon